MLNKKKLEMTFKKYKKNWIEEIESKIRRKSMKKLRMKLMI